MNTGLNRKNAIIAKYKNSFKSPYKLIETANKGLRAVVFFDVAMLTGFNRDLLAEMLNASVKTFMRYRHNNIKLSPINSEQLLKILALYQKGKDVFGNLESLNKWLQKPAYGLSNQTPLNLMKTSTGMDLIYDELKRIESGDLA